MDYNDIYERVSKETNIPKEVVREAYKSLWKFIRNTIKELPLKEELTEEEFNKLRTNFNIPSLGKLYSNYKIYNSINENYRKRIKLKEIREKNEYKED